MPQIRNFLYALIVQLGLSRGDSLSTGPSAWQLTSDLSFQDYFQTNICLRSRSFPTSSRSLNAGEI
jgi:hypothetical protein